MVSPVLPLHLGPLHPVEQLLVYALAFGPFLVLAVVVVVRRRADRLEDARHADGAVDGEAGQRDR